ncbi:MAG: glutathione S-transferase [Myxococcales bacterium]
MSGGAPPLLFSDRGCPFSHRALSLLSLLDIEHEHREVPVGQTPAGLYRYSRAGHLPLLVHDGLVLPESRVMLEYLAERYGMRGAFPDDVAARAIHRLAMTRVDGVLTRHLGLDAPVPGDADGLRDALDALEAATQLGPPGSDLLTLHVAPIWHALRTWRPDGIATQAIEARPVLYAWLTAAADLPAVADNAADPSIIAADVRAAREAGLLPAPEA